MSKIFCARIKIDGFFVETKLHKQRGFTLIELVCVLFIVLILCTIAAPLYSRSKAKLELDLAARQIVTDIRKWQQRSVVEQKTGLKLTVNKEERKYYLKESLNTIEIHDLSKAVSSFSVSPDNLITIEFYTNGMTSGAGTFTLKNRYGSYKYIVILNTTGRVRISSTPP